MSGTLFGIDASTYSLWRGAEIRMPNGVERNRTCAADWARDLRARREHPKDGHFGALLRNAYEMPASQILGRSRVTYEFKEST